MLILKRHSTLDDNRDGCESIEARARFHRCAALIYMDFTLCAVRGLLLMTTSQARCALAQ